MRLLQRVALSCLLVAGCAMAQRGGGGHGGGGGFGGGGFHGGGMGGGGFRGGGGWGGGGFRGGWGGGGFRGGFGGFRGGFGGFRGGFGGFRGIGWGGWGWGSPWWGWGWGPGWGVGVGWGGVGYGGVGVPYGGAYDSSYYYPTSDMIYSADTSAPSYAPGPQVVYPTPSVTNVTVNTPRPVIHEYDQFGQEVQGYSGPSGGSLMSGNGSPIYLLAMKDKSIHAVASYWVNGQTLHWVTLERQERQAPLSEVDRDLTLRLNHERHIPFQLP